MGSRKAISGLEYTTKKTMYYSLYYTYGYHLESVVGYFWINVSAKGILSARKKANEIADEYMKSEGLDEKCVYLLRKWEKMDHKPRHYNKVVKAPMIRVKI